MLQGGRLGKSLVAILAQIRPLARVGPHVASQTCTLCKPLATLKMEDVSIYLYYNCTFWVLRHCNDRLAYIEY